MSSPEKMLFIAGMTGGLNVSGRKTWPIPTTALAALHKKSSAISRRSCVVAVRAVGAQNAGERIEI